ncbi:MAG: alpha-hydroxy-acid oxidizing protein [Clostridia bacterium]|nr:alpha-hydroxy-acid oxidizing protein [Clostridia bacterium]
MTYTEVLNKARECNGGICKACPVCDGRACGNAIPGPGAKDSGDVFARNFAAWRNIRVNMDTICGDAPVDTGIELFGRKFKYPFFAAPVGALKLHYGDKHDDLSYNDILVPACAEAGVAAFTGDGSDPAVFTGAIAAIKNSGGLGIPTVKPWDAASVKARIDMAKEAGVMALAMDVDAAGLPFLKNVTPAVSGKSAAELREFAQYAGLPFIVKGIMTVAGAEKAAEAGAYAIVVSNHGGRVLDQTPATAEVLEAIADAVGGKVKIFVDGGIRSGVDIFKALALGADAVLIARPYVNMVYGGGREGVAVYTEKLGRELRETMEMCGTHSLSEINKNSIFRG